MLVQVNSSILKTKYSNINKDYNQSNNLKINLKENGINLNNCPLSLYNVSFHAKPMLAQEKLKNFQGCLLGGAIGDAFGAPLEKLPMQEIQRRFHGSLKYLIKQKDGIAEFTDDTQMTLFTIDGLLGSIHKFSEQSDEYYRNILKSYKKWYITQVESEPISGAKGLMALAGLYEKREPGNTCLSSLQSDKFGTIDNPINDSAGNGGVMRVAPVGLLYCNNPELSFEVGMKIAALTHGHPRGFLPAGFLSCLIAYIIKGNSFEDALELTKSVLKKYPEADNLLNKISKAQELAKEDTTEEQAISILGSGWTGDEALAIAIYSNLKHFGDFKKIIITSANHGGDSDTTAAIAGNIAGVLNSVDNIPNQWKKSIDMSTLLEKYAHFLYHIANNSASQI